MQAQKLVPQAPFQYNDFMEIYLTKLCKTCNNPFTPDKMHQYQIFCLQKCRDRFNHRKKKNAKKLQNSLRIFTCMVCGIKYKPTYSYQRTCAKRKCVLALWHKKKQQDPEFRKKRALWQRNRKHRIRANGGNLTITEWKTIKKNQDYTCNICKKREPEIKLTMDHIIAIKNKGKHEASNIQGLCISCNARKD